MSDNNNHSERTPRQSGDPPRNTVINAPIRGYVGSVTDTGVVNGFVQNIVYIQISGMGGKSKLVYNFILTRRRLRLCYLGDNTIFSDSASDLQSGQEVQNLIQAIMRLQEREAQRRDEANATTSQRRRGHQERARSLP
jgi:Ca2+-binding RTX toxin-like protein